MPASLGSSPAGMVALVVAMMAVLVEPHMIMATPKPYGNPDNSPLTSANYPCKVTSDPATFYKTAGIIDQNTMVAGENQTLSFTGSAVHGGGSCQLAITSDMQPTAETSWRVILSIESGCPSKDGTSPGTYDYTIPADLTPGQYSFAWTWISKLAGQPEYYMNCAPITVTAGKTKRDEGVSLLPRDDSYPELFVGNLDTINSCKSTPSTDPEYPDPGPRVEKALESSAAFASISGTSCVPKGQTEGAGALPTATAGNAGGAASASATATASSAAGQQSSNPGAGGSPSGGGVFATTGGAAGSSAAPPTTLVTSTSSTPPATSVYVSPVTPAPVASATSSSDDDYCSATEPAPSATDSPPSSSATPPSSSATLPSSSAMLPSSSATPPSSSATPPSSATPTTTKPAPSATLSPTGGGSGSGNSTGSGGGSSSGKSGPCTSEGMFNCIGSQYQQCASGAWTAMKALPGGTTCTQGESENLWARGADRPTRARKLRWGGKRWMTQGV